MNKAETQRPSLISDKVLKNTLLYWHKNRHLAPGEHYFHTFLAYALMSYNMEDMAITELEEYFNIKNRGHLEFNKYALASIYSEYCDTLPLSLKSKIYDFIFDNNFSVSDKTCTGNNWVFLRALIHLKIFLISNEKSELDSFKYYLNFVLKFEHKGMFYDFPPQSMQHKEKVFPYTYSVKMLSILMEIYYLLAESSICPKLQEAVKASIDRCLPAHLRMIAPDGEALYYGRSDNTLFGYGNLLYMLYNITPSSKLIDVRESCERYINENFSQNGILATCLPYSGYKDSYIHDSVYIAYFAAKYIQSQRALKEKSLSVSRESDTHSICTENNSGFTLQGESFFHFISSEGSSPNDKTTEFFGYRYAGLSPLKLYHHKRQNTCILRLNRKRITDNVSNLPFTPTISYPSIKLNYLKFKNLRSTSNNEVQLISGTSIPDIKINNIYIEITINRVKAVLPPFIRLTLSRIKARFLQKLELNRKISINLIDGRISIEDNYKKRLFTSYILPDSWALTADQIIEKIKLEDCNLHKLRASHIKITSPAHSEIH